MFEILVGGRLNLHIAIVSPPPRQKNARCDWRWLVFGISRDLQHPTPKARDFLGARLICPDVVHRAGSRILRKILGRKRPFSGSWNLGTSYGHFSRKFAVEDCVNWRVNAGTSIPLGRSVDPFPELAKFVQCVTSLAQIGQGTST